MSRKAFEEWAGKREIHHTTSEWDAMHRAWQSATAASEKEIAALKSQRDDLLAALKHVYEYDGHSLGMIGHALAKNAIAKAEGSAA